MWLQEFLSFVKIERRVNEQNFLPQVHLNETQTCSDFCLVSDCKRWQFQMTTAVATCDLKKAPVLLPWGYKAHFLLDSRRYYENCSFWNYYLSELIGRPAEHHRTKFVVLISTVSPTNALCRYCELLSKSSRNKKPIFSISENQN